MYPKRGIKIPPARYGGGLVCRVILQREIE